MKPGGTIILTAEQFDELADHAASCMPNESCALLIGRYVARDSMVEKVEVVKNIDASPERQFSVGVEELIGHYRKAESRGAEVVGIFHSHPTSGTHPSPTDERYMAANPVAWVIYSVRDDDFCAYAMDGHGKSVEVDIGMA